MISLRGCFELLLIGIHFDYNLQDYELWSKDGKDERNLPRSSFGRAVRWVFDNLPSFKHFDEKYGLEKELNDFYDEYRDFYMPEETYRRFS